MSHVPSPWSLFVLGCAALVAASCSGPLAPTPPTTTRTPDGSATPGQTSALATPSPVPTGTADPTAVPLTTLSSTTDLGTVTIDIPTALLPAEESISAESRPFEEAPRVLRNAGVRQDFHVLLPEDLTFEQPVRVAVTMPRARFERGDGSIAITYLALRDLDGDWRWLGDAHMTVTSETVQLSGTTYRFGALFAWTDRTNLLPVEPGLEARLVGRPFAVNVQLVSLDQRATPVAILGEPDFVPSDPARIEISPMLFTATGRDLRCLAEGSFGVTFIALLQNFAADNQFFAATLGLPPMFGRLTYVMSGSCTSGALSSPTPNSSPTSSP